MGVPWTDARLKAFIISGLRAASRRYPPKFETLNEAKTEKKTNAKTGRLAQHYLCKKCKQEYVAADVQVDHIIPVVDPVLGFANWDNYINRLFCSKDNLQVLCLTCHQLKSNEEKLRKITNNTMLGITETKKNVPGKKESGVKKTLTNISKKQKNVTLKTKKK